MTSKSLKIGAGHNPLPTIKGADNADYLFIGSIGPLMQWSVSQEKMTKEYAGIMAGCVGSMAQIRKKNYLCLSDWEGC